MCLAVPARVIERLEGDEAIVDLGGVRKRISLAMVEDVLAGDYVIVHVGYALQRLDPEEAQRTLELFAQVSASAQHAGAADAAADAAPAGAAAGEGASAGARP